MLKLDPKFLINHLIAGYYCMLNAHVLAFARWYCALEHFVVFTYYERFPVFRLITYFCDYDL